MALEADRPQMVHVRYDPSVCDDNYPPPRPRQDVSPGRIRVDINGRRQYARGGPEMGIHPWGRFAYHSVPPAGLGGSSAAPIAEHVLTREPRPWLDFPRQGLLHRPDNLYRSLVVDHDVLRLSLIHI